MAHPRLPLANIFVRLRPLTSHFSTLTSPAADEKYIFANETTRYLQNNVARGPAIRSDAAREEASENVTAVEVGEGQWDCAAVSDAALRKSLGLETYRYLWAGKLTSSLL